MIRSRFLWKLYAGFALFIVATAILVFRLAATHPAAVTGLCAGLLGVAFLVARRFTRTLRGMTAAAKAIAEGDDERRVVAADRNDELGSLADAFNAMRARLRTQLEAATLERSRLEAILASMVEGVVAIDSDERIVHVNQVAADLIGLVPGKVVGRPIWEVSRQTAVNGTLRRALESQAPAEGEMRLPGRNERQIELRATPLRGGPNGLSGAVLVLDDRTTVRRLETVRQDFVANVSHELKTPVTAIRGLAETLLDDPAMPVETAQSFLDRIREQSLRLSSLVTDLLSLSRLDATRSGRSQENADHGVIDARQAVRSAVRALGSASETKKIRVSIDVPEMPARVCGDLRALEEAVSNLLDNAIKYSPAGETVDVRLVANQTEVEIEVSDHGLGIAANHQDRIFERFYRVDAARSREIGGTGLGLAIVKHIVRAMEGEIEVDSEPGRGSTFTIRLPRHRGS